jgi:phosphoserine phosphatase RsbU/P
MLQLRAVPKPLLAAVAALFAAAIIFYSLLWMFASGSWMPVQLGFDNVHLQAQHGELLTNIYKNSPAEQAGLRVGDRILEVDGKSFETAYSLTDIWSTHKPGDAVNLTIQRPGIPSPFVVRAVFRAFQSPWAEGGLSQRLGQDIISTFPVAFLVVGLTVLFLRLEDRNAWLLALMFAGAIAVPAFRGGFQVLGPTLRKLAMADRAIFVGFNPAIFYLFFAVFPVRSPLDRKVPWLKWAGLMIGVLMALPGLSIGVYQTPAIVGMLLGYRVADGIRLSYGYGFVILGLLSLVGNAFSAITPEARRKIRVILWGTLVGVVPMMLALGAQEIFGFQITLWLAVALVLLLYLFPLSFAYAVVKHRVLEIPVLLRRSARYLLVQRGFLFLQIAISVVATGIFAWGMARVHVIVPLGFTGAVMFGSALALAGIRVHTTAAQRIDRAFFRNAYDARVILEDLVDKTRTATNRSELAALLEHHLKEALRPSSFAIYLEEEGGQLTVAAGRVPANLGMLPASQPMLADLARHRRLWDDSNPVDPSPPLILASLRPDCLVPVPGRDSRLVGLLVLGPRLSEEPYSREDKHLLASVASQAGLALESIRLGEEIADRIEAERRAAQEMEYAREVQARLFPQRLPPLSTMEYAGRCLQARQVGGDYYDFLSLASGRVGIVLADIAGKGIAGALLMANLQANLRSQYALALEDLPELLKSVNELFYENTGDQSYATLFFGDYDDSARRLRYVNCGHLPPLLLRQNGTFDRLAATATVLGLFENWDCAAAEIELAPGDLLVLYTDGVTEATDPAGEEFGECRLMKALYAQHHLPVLSLLETVVKAVENFSPGEHADDITLVVARCKNQVDESSNS